MGSHSVALPLDDALSLVRDAIQPIRDLEDRMLSSSTPENRDLVWELHCRSSVASERLERLYKTYARGDDVDDAIAFARAGVAFVVVACEGLLDPEEGGDDDFLSWAWTGLFYYVQSALPLIGRGATLKEALEATFDEIAEQAPPASGRLTHG